MPSSHNSHGAMQQNTCSLRTLTMSTQPNRFDPINRIEALRHQNITSPSTRREQQQQEEDAASPDPHSWIFQHGETRDENTTLSATFLPQVGPRTMPFISFMLNSERDEVDATRQTCSGSVEFEATECAGSMGEGELSIEAENAHMDVTA
jgi:hypothetical protein